MGSVISSVWQRLRQHPIRWIVYILIALFALALEMGGELLSLIGISDPGNKAIALSMVYQRFATAGYNKPRPHYVRLIVLSPVYEPQDIFGDICKKREFEAALLNKLTTLSPSVVVLDFWYSPQSCKDGEDRERARKLEQAILESSSHFPVVLGLSSHNKHEFQLEQDPDLPDLVKLGFSGKDLILDQNPHFEVRISTMVSCVLTQTRGEYRFFGTYIPVRLRFDPSPSLKHYQIWLI